MDLTWLQGLFLGFISGLADVLPVSAQAHRLMLLKVFGETGEGAVLQLFVHMATLASLYFCTRNQIVRMSRAASLAKIPKRKRRRPLDKRSLIDMSLLKTTLIPIVLAFIFYLKAQTLASNPLLLAAFLFLNGVILYVPQYLPGGNKDSTHMTRVEGLLLGLGGAASVVPGISCVGTTYSIGNICGMDRNYALNMALLMNIPVNIGLILFDFVAIFQGGAGGISFGGVMACFLAAIGAFGGVFLGIKLLRKIASGIDFSVFGFYCWGAALFTFVLYLTAA